ncbi:MAG: class I SAM-dependent DNA methyltransferase [Acutalibacteraceae bacterium]
MSGGYTVFSEFYDSLTSNVHYSERADYIEKLLKRYNHNPGITLDLACGTGSLTIELKKRGFDIYGADGSSDMLMIAQQKAYEEELSILFLCQKMQKLDLYGTIDTCICTLDSINHIINKDELQTAFDKVSLFMNKGGIFVFDVNTVYKHKYVLADNVFVYDKSSVFCVWQNTPLKDNITRIQLDFFEKSGNMYRRSSESFCERAYTSKELEEIIKKAGFEILDIFGEMTFDSPKDDSQRNVYVVKKTEV